jgi:hypothetical protein
LLVGGALLLGEPGWCWITIPQCLRDLGRTGEQEIDVDAQQALRGLALQHL